MKIKSQKDFFAGLMFMIVGGGFAWGATSYTIGDGARMGPGYFPLMVGILLSIVGVAVMFQSLVVETEDGGKIGAFAWKPLGFIIGANVIFGICIGGIPRIAIPGTQIAINIGLPSMGLIVGIYALTFVAAKAGEEFNTKEVAILATILAVLSYVAFIWGLKLQFPVWPSFLTR
ncbi:tripartite tricarboxylate transporter TctB family protein [Ramlibacter sp.]|uniref:tripartite tricarboxylate transporter TctB family protein n=1 Tax=Ramlibacter sp. TaxID=1917967 RepID=UPI0035B0CAC7